MKNTIKIKLNKNIKGMKSGKILSIATDPSGIPLDAYWRRRLKDMAIDRCIEIIIDEPVLTVETSVQTDEQSTPAESASETI